MKICPVCKQRPVILPQRKYCGSECRVAAEVQKKGHVRHGGKYWCEFADHWWERTDPTLGGRPPKTCLDHRGPAASRKAAKWQKANPEKTRHARQKSWRKYYAEHSEELIAKAVARDRANPENKRARDSAYYARTRGSVGAELFTLNEIFQRDEGVCHLCHRPVERANAAMDHVEPASLGGPHTRANVKLAHFSCNSSRGVMPVTEWQTKHGLLVTA